MKDKYLLLTNTIYFSLGLIISSLMFSHPELGCTVLIVYIIYQLRKSNLKKDMLKFLAGFTLGAITHTLNKDVVEYLITFTLGFMIYASFIIVTHLQHMME